MTSPLQRTRSSEASTHSDLPGQHITSRMRSLRSSALLALLLAACDNGSQSRERPTFQIPSDLTYTVIDSSTHVPFRRSLNVRLNREVSEEVLRAIAFELKSRDPREFERTFIAYYLPDMIVGAGAWAVTDFDPAFEVSIHGFTATEKQELSRPLDPIPQNVIGRWLDERPFGGSRITLSREGKQVVMERVYKDGSTTRSVMIAKVSPLGLRFDLAQEMHRGDHWVIRPNGSLEIRDNEGLIVAARPIK